MAKIIFKDVWKKYPNGFHAVKGINLEVNDRESIVFLGPSGCGKTTTLRMLAGLEDITEGEVYIGDKLVNDVKPKDRDIGMVFQSYALFPHMTVFENIAFGLKPKQFSDDEIKKAVAEVAEIMGITHLLERKPDKLSGGQRQRTALCRALVCRHEVILLDEPLSCLDMVRRAEMRVELMKLKEKFNTTFIFVTHDQNEAMVIADRIVLMRDGIIEQIGTAEELYERPHNTFVAGFTGMPRINFWDTIVGKIGDEFYINCGEAKLKFPKDKIANTKISNYVGKKVIAGVRPEDLHVGAESDGCYEMVDTEVQLSVFHFRERHLHLAIKNNEGLMNFVACVPTMCDAKVGDKFEIAVNIGKVYLFDEETKETIVF